MKLAIEEIKTRLTQEAAKLVPADEAAEFARLMVQQHLHKAPAIMPLQEAVDNLKVWREQGVKEPLLKVDKPGLAIWDCQGMPPSLKVAAIQADLEQRARQNGVALAGLVNNGGIITLNMWAVGLADRGLFGLAAANGGVESVVPFGGTRGYFGTNPLAYAVPTATRPLIVDMATSEIAYFRIRQAFEKGQTLPPGAAVDNQGQPTTDPNQAFSIQEGEQLYDGVANLLPLGGGFKGYGLVMLVEVLTGALIGARMSDTQAHGWNPPEYGTCLLAVDPSPANGGGVAGATGFAQTMTALAEDLRAQTCRADLDSVPAPGDRGWANLDAAKAAGEIELSDELGGKLMELGE